MLGLDMGRKLSPKPIARRQRYHRDMTFVFSPPQTPSVAVARSDVRFPVRRVFCVGRNYAAHAIEMGGDPTREAPFFFTKPADAVIDDGVTIPYPPQTEDFHHEAELVVAIGKAGQNVSVDDALEHVWGYAPGNDLTRRDLQRVAKERGRPWDMSKGFDRSAVIGALCPASEVGHPTEGSIQCIVNDEMRQDANLNELIWKIPEIVSLLSETVAIEPGDLILTGTPAGVGPLQPGDTCVVRIAGLGEVRTTID